MKKLRWMLLWLGMMAALGCNLLTTAPGAPTATNAPPTVTDTPEPTATLTPAPTPLPTATPIPSVRVGAGDTALFNGDFARARDEYRTALNGAQDDEVRAAALWGLGRTEFEAENYFAALDNLRQLVTTYPNADDVARAYFLLGDTYNALGRYQEALNAYQQYLALRPGQLDYYVHIRRAEVFESMIDNQNALIEYQSALTADHIQDDVALNIKIAQLYAALSAGSKALTLYDDIFNSTSNDYVRAQMDFLAGQEWLKAGQTEAAYERFRHAVENYPLAYESYLALVALIDAGQTVSDLDRGIIDYYAEQYGVALAALERYIANSLDTDGTAAYYRGLTLKALGNYSDAVDAWTEFIDKHPENKYWSNAWSDKANTLWVYLDQYTAAAQTLTRFVEVAPTSPFAAAYLREAGRIYERADLLPDAALTWERVITEYPANDVADEALFLAGITRYRLQDYQGALVNFQRITLLSVPEEAISRAHLWVGKTYEKLGDQTAKEAAWQKAQQIDIKGYYSERARDLLLGKSPFASPAILAIPQDLATERIEAEAWLRVTFNLPTTTNLNGPGALLQNQSLWRGTEFWQMGMYSEARGEFESLRNAVSASAEDSFRLANYLLDIGAYRSAIFAARQVLTLAGLESQAESLAGPRYFSHIRFGFYYNNLIAPAAETYNLNPLFVVSVIRQESLFEGFAGSSAGARGLMQIIPPTGESIATKMGWPPDYTADDLYRPLVSINMGAYYLNANRHNLNNDLYATLAAYNGGPGNAAIWQNLAGNDPDLFLEVVRFEETRNYIRSIYEIYNIYDSLYNPLATQ